MTKLIDETAVYSPIMTIDTQQWSTDSQPSRLEMMGWHDIGRYQTENRIHIDNQTLKFSQWEGYKNQKTGVLTIKTPFMQPQGNNIDATILSSYHAGPYQRIADITAEGYFYTDLGCLYATVWEPLDPTKLTANAQGFFNHRTNVPNLDFPPDIFFRLGDFRFDWTVADVFYHALYFDKDNNVLFAGTPDYYNFGGHDKRDPYGNDNDNNFKIMTHRFSGVPHHAQYFSPLPSSLQDKPQALYLTYILKLVTVNNSENRVNDYI